VDVVVDINVSIMNSSNKSMVLNNNMFGYESLTDFGTSLIKSKAILLAVFPAFGMLIHSFITGYVYSSAEPIYIMWILLLLDWVSGIAKAMYFKEFVSSKLLRTPIKILVYSAVMGIAWQMGQHLSVFTYLPIILLSLFYADSFFSLLENFGELKLIPKPIIYVLKEKFGIKAIINRFDTSEKISDKGAIDKENIKNGSKNEKDKPNKKPILKKNNDSGDDDPIID
jgi:phage-related holin